MILPNFKLNIIYLLYCPKEPLLYTSHHSHRKQIQDTQTEPVLSIQFLAPKKKKKEKKKAS